METQKIRIKGKLSIFRTNPVNSELNEDIICLTHDNITSPVTDMFLKLIHEHPLHGRINYFKYKKVLSVICKGRSQEKEDFVLQSIDFSITGWEFNDDDAMESGSGINIVDSINTHKTLKTELLSLLGQNVELVLTPTIKK